MPELKLRGWMIDAARLPEPLSYYRRLIDVCAGWGINIILLRLADDQGSAIRFSSHPELITHPEAYSAAELLELAGYANQRGVELIPEIESFGHTGFITRCPAYAHLLDARPGSNNFTGVIPNHPETMAILGDLYHEVADLFPSHYLHGGCDEVNWGGSEISQAAIAERGRAAVWIEHLNRLNDLAHSLGKELLIWADHVLGGAESEDLLSGLARDIILVDWNYWENEPARQCGWDERPGPIQSNARRALRAGFRLIGAPAWGWCRWGVRAGENQRRNIDAFADIYRAIPDPNCLGVVVTNWVPSRFIQGAIWDAPAYAGVALNEGSAAARQTAYARFISNHYGASWNAAWAEVFHALDEVCSPRAGCSAAWMAPFQPPIWADEAGLLAISQKERIPFAMNLPFARIQGELAACSASVTRNLLDFQSFVLAVQYLEHLYWRCEVVCDPNLTIEKANDLIQVIALRDQQMADALEKEWDRTRFPSSPAKSSRLADLSLEDQTLFSMQRAAVFSAGLAAQPDHFARLVMLSKKS